MVKSLTDKKIWDSYAIVKERYSTREFVSEYPQVFFRGTPNQFETTPMTLVDDYTWRITVTVGSSDAERFKFDINGDWSLNFGDNNGDGIAEQSGADIPITQGPGDYTITFNDQAKTYTVVKQGQGFQSSYPHVFFRGTPNSWETTPMKLVSDYTWEISVNFGRGNNQRFKFDVNGDWSNNFGDNTPVDGVADPTGSDIPITEGSGSYTITFNDQTSAYTVTKN